MHQSNSIVSLLADTAMKQFLDQDQRNVVLLMDHEGIIRYGNRLYSHRLEIDMQQFSGRHISELIPNVSFAAIIDNFKYAAEQKPSVQLVLNECTSMESKYSIFSVCHAWEDDATKRGYIMVLHDLSCKDVASELRRIFPSHMMREVNLGMIVVDMDFRLINISEMACTILGIERDDVLGRTMEEAFANIPIEYQLVQRDILDGQVVRNHALSWTNNQERYELLMDSSLLKNEQGHTIGAIIIFKDVTNLRSLEEQVQRSDRLAMIGQISAGTAHEIRNPLTSIKGFLQILNRTMEERKMEKEFQYTEIMLNEIDRINNLVSEFLLLSKPKHALIRKVKLSTVINEILPIIRNEAVLYNVTVDYHANENLPSIIADRELLKQVCLNVSKNGIEAMSDEGGKLILSEEIDPEERKVQILIHDTGSGIPSFLIDKIFDPFFTTKEKGTGLGLSVCQRIIHDMGGHIRVASKGFGTTFTISIPYSED